MQSSLKLTDMEETCFFFTFVHTCTVLKLFTNCDVSNYVVELVVPALYFNIKSLYINISCLYPAYIYLEID